jgi:hypothetical protein
MAVSVPGTERLRVEATSLYRDPSRDPDAAWGVMEPPAPGIERRSGE